MATLRLIPSLTTSIKDERDGHSHYNVRHLWSRISANMVARTGLHGVDEWLSIGARLFLNSLKTGECVVIRGTPSVSKL
jgi:hypothetical protein